MSEPESMQPLTALQREMLEAATSRYESAISVPVAQWLIGRGIDRQTAVGARLGYVAEPVSGHNSYRGRLAIPYLARDGHPLTIRFRCLQPHRCKDVGCPKYLGLPDEPSRMYGVRDIHEAENEIHVAEGELDRLILKKALGVPTVALPGANAWRPRHRRMLLGFSRIYVWADPDDAGDEMVHRLTKQLRAARGVSLSVGDITETYLAGGADALRAALQESV